MPFTFAHPAASIPLLRPLGRYGVLSALVIGSFAPDLAYFLPFYVARIETHSLAGLFWFCLPAGLLAYLLFHHFLKAPLLDLLPELASRGLGGDAHGAPPARLRAVIISLLCGGLTHLAWDAFTHDTGLAVTAFPLLQAQLFSLGVYPVYAFNLLQHISTLIGSALIVCWCWRWLKRTPRQTPATPRMLSPLPPRAVIVCLALVPTAAGIVSGLNGIGSRRGLLALQAFASEAAYAALPALTAVVLLYCAGWQLWRIRIRMQVG